MPKKTNSKKGQRWHDVSSWTEPSKETVDDFKRAARALISRDGAASRELMELGVDIADYLAAAFSVPIDAESERWLRVCDPSKTEEPGLQRRRVQALEQIAQYVQLTSGGADAGQALQVLRWNLSWSDPALAAGLEGDIGLEKLAERLREASLQPRGHRGAKGPHTVLAELVVFEADAGALGFDVDMDADAPSEISRIRGALERDQKKISV